MLVVVVAAAKKQKAARHARRSAWVDGDGQTRKVAATVDRAGIKVETEMEYYDFGVELDVSADRLSIVLTARTTAPTRNREYGA